MGFLGLLTAPSAELSQVTASSYDKAAESVAEDLRQKDQQKADAAKQAAHDASVAGIRAQHMAQQQRDRQFKVFQNEAKGSYDWHSQYLDPQKYTSDDIAKARAKVQSSSDYNAQLENAYANGQPLPPPPSDLATRTDFNYSPQYQDEINAQHNQKMLGLVATAGRIAKQQGKPVNPLEDSDVQSLQQSNFSTSSALDELSDASKRLESAKQPQVINGISMPPDAKTLIEAQKDYDKARRAYDASSIVQRTAHANVMRAINNGYFDRYYGDPDESPKSALTDLLAKQSVAGKNPAFWDAPTGMWVGHAASLDPMSIANYADPEYRSLLLQQIQRERQGHNVSSNPKLSAAYANLYDILAGTSAPHRAVAQPVGATGSAETPEAPPPKAAVGLSTVDPPEDTGGDEE